MEIQKAAKGKKLRGEGLAQRRLNATVKKSQVPRDHIGICCASSGKVVNLGLPLVSVEGIFE